MTEFEKAKQRFDKIMMQTVGNLDLEDAVKYKKQMNIEDILKEREDTMRARQEFYSEDYPYESMYL